MLWYCENCEYEFSADPPCGDDWGDEMVACEPCCPRCGEDSDVVFIEDDPTTEG